MNAYIPIISCRLFRMVLLKHSRTFLISCCASQQWGRCGGIIPHAIRDLGEGVNTVCLPFHPVSSISVSRQDGIFYFFSSLNSVQSNVQRYSNDAIPKPGEVVVVVVVGSWWQLEATFVSFLDEELFGGSLMSSIKRSSMDDMNTTTRSVTPLFVFVLFLIPHPVPVVDFKLLILSQCFNLKCGMVVHVIFDRRFFIVNAVATAWTLLS